MASKGNSSKPVAMPASRDQSVHVSVKKISNGYVVSQSKDTPRGYSHTETFHATKPKMAVSVASTPKRK